MSESWEYYDDIARFYDGQYEEPYWHLYHEILHKLVGDSIQTDGRLLDLGTGTGRWAIHFAALDFDVTAIDPSKEMLSVLEGKSRDYDVQIDLIDATAESLPFDDRSFDYVTAMGDVISYTRDHERAIFEVYRVLRENGRFLLTVDSAYAFLQDFLSHTEFSRAESFLLADRYVTIGDVKMSRRSFRTYPFFPEELRSKLERAGFRVIDTAGMVVLGPYVNSRLASSLPEVAEWEYRFCRESELLGRAEHLFFACEKG